MVLPIIQYGAPILRKKCKPIRSYNVKLLELIENMKETMIHANGVGVAAPQVGVDKQLFLVDASIVNPSMGILVVINPSLTILDHKELIEEEGCLSIPGLYARVKRPKQIQIDAFNEKGEAFTSIFNDYLARVVLHEYDHLQGILFTDKVLIAEKDTVNKQLDKLRKQNA